MNLDARPTSLYLVACTQYLGDVNWWNYVTKVGGTNNAAIAARIGISAPAVGRWRESVPSPENVVAFARAHGRPVLEAFVEAGYISAEDARATVVRPDLGALTDDELIEEIRARLSGARVTMPLPQHDPRTPETVEAVRQATRDLAERVKSVSRRKGMNQESREAIISDLMADHAAYLARLLEAQDVPDVRKGPNSVADAG